MEIVGKFKNMIMMEIGSIQNLNENFGPLKISKIILYQDYK